MGNKFIYHKGLLMSSYLDDFQAQINNRDFSKFLQLWEEYCTNDTIDVEEFTQILKALKNSDFVKSFGRFVETALPLWQTIQDPKGKYEVLRLLIDLQTTNTPALADLTLEALKEAHGNHPQFNDRLRLIGLRNRENFQGAISYYDILNHMEKGKFVYHTGGWGTGEIMDVSLIREQAAIEFEKVSGQKHVTFANAFKSLIPLADDNFLARRFADADALEEDARNNPVDVIKVLLRDLGPKNAGEIKDELCELVIPEKDWSKWWSSTRTKIKKDPMIETPENIRDPFRLRKQEMTSEDRLKKTLQKKGGITETILNTYNFIRDLPNIKKNLEVKNTLKEKTLELLTPDLTPDQELQILILLENFFDHKVEGKSASELIKKLSNPEEVLNSIEIIALKKRALTIVRELRKDWADLFLSMLFSVQQSALREYIMTELNQGETQKLLIKKLKDLAEHPVKHPEFLVWFFQKLVSEKGEENIPYSDKAGQCLFFEAFLILFSALDGKSEYRDLSKKMYNLLSGKRYAVVRSIIEGTDVTFLKEFLLLVSKCQSLTDHDAKILRSLAEVVQPSLAAQKNQKARKHTDGHTIWTTEEGYLRIQDRIKQIGTKEIIENAREVEAARALGDLRENSEYKFAVEKRHRLQGELKVLSDQLHKARIITAQDIFPDEVSIGSIVTVEDGQGKLSTFTILGPWDANADVNILSFQSKLAQAMIGCKLGETFRFKDDDFLVKDLKSIFDK